MAVRPRSGIGGAHPGPAFEVEVDGRSPVAAPGRVGDWVAVRRPVSRGAQALAGAEQAVVVAHAVSDALRAAGAAVADVQANLAPAAAVALLA